jgi:hypothetical protein
MTPDDRAKLIQAIRKDIEDHRMMAQTQMAHASLNLWRERYALALRHLQQAVRHGEDAERALHALQTIKGTP